MDVTNFSDADLARLALSTRLRDLAEEFRTAVASDATAPGSSERLEGKLLHLLATQMPQLQREIVQHARATGASWAEVAKLTDVTEEEARERWGHDEMSRTTTPADDAAALDDWYIRHAQLEPLAHVRDPFSRLLSAFSRAPHECPICLKYRGGALPAYGGYTSPPGGYLLDDGIWRVGHGPTAYWPAGTLLIESHRHFLDFADMNDTEATAIGAIIRRFTGPLKEATGAPRVHAFACMEGAEHFHLWMVPRTGETASGRGFIANPGYCSIPEAEAAIAALRRALAEAEDR